MYPFKIFLYHNKFTDISKNIKCQLNTETMNGFVSSCKIYAMFLSSFYKDQMDFAKDTPTSSDISRSQGNLSNVQ